MDYPVSDQFAKLQEGKFTDGDPQSNTPPSKNSAAYMNAVYDELLGVISGGGLSPSENQFNQLVTAISNISRSIVSSQTAGQISTFPGTTVPAGWLHANGQTISRTQYPYLFAYANASGNMAASEEQKEDGQFGPGDNSETFSLPDLRGIHIRNWDDQKGIDAGRAIGTSQSDQNKSHNHSASTDSAGGHTHGASTNTTGSHSHSASSATAGGHSHTYGVLKRDGGTSNILTGSETLAGGQEQPRTNTTNTTNSTGSHSHAISVGSAGNHSHSVTVTSAGSHTHDVTVNSDGGTETRVKNIALMACIKY